MTPTLKYEFELWINGVLVGDITKLMQNRHLSLTRNLPEELTFTMSLSAFEDYCTDLGVLPQAVLETYVTDIRIRRNGNYWFGVHVVDMTYNLNQGEINVEVKAAGFLFLLGDRYVTKTYTQTERVAMALDLIATTQVGDASNNYGITPGTRQYSTGVLSDREYVDQNVRDALVNLTDLSDGSFDFKFNYDRSFETFSQIGSDRPDNKFTYPYNITSGRVAHTALNLYNYIIGIGSGFGEEALRTETADGASRGNYKTHQKIVTFNSVSQQQTLDENSYAYLQKVKNILELPTFNVSGEFANLDVIGIGDRVPIEVVGHPALPLNDTYRIERLDVTLDENDAEDIAITVDNYGL